MIFENSKIVKIINLNIESANLIRYNYMLAYNFLKICSNENK